MSPRTVEAVVEGGNLRPLQQLELPEQQHVILTIVPVLSESRDGISCYDLALGLGVIGTAGETPDDLSTNPQHFKGFGGS